MSGDDNLERWAPASADVADSAEHSSTYAESVRAPVTEPELPSRSDSFDPHPVRTQLVLTVMVGAIFAAAGTIVLLASGDGVRRVLALVYLVCSLLFTAAVYGRLRLALDLFQSGEATLGVVVEQRRFLTAYTYEVNERTYRKRQWLPNLDVKFIAGDHLWVLHDVDRPTRSAPALWARQVVLADSSRDST